MPELPEVETVRRGLEGALTGATILSVDQRRPDLRFPFPERLAERLQGRRILEVGRRAKFLLFPLDNGETLIAHLGMTGRFTVEAGDHTLAPGAFYAPDPPSGHDHLVLGLQRKSGGEARLTFSDPRRFGFIELYQNEDLLSAARMTALGPEPLDPGFDAAYLQGALAKKATPLKSALLDQKVVAGLGNIYVCEALFRARLSPRRRASTVGAQRAGRLVEAIKTILEEAIAAGGSTLRDYAGAQGEEGAFQQKFSVYDRAGDLCFHCANPVQRIVQSGRSTFFCSACQR